MLSSAGLDRTRWSLLNGAREGSRERVNRFVRLFSWTAPKEWVRIGSSEILVRKFIIVNRFR